MSMEIAKWVTPDPATVETGETLRTALVKMSELRIGAIPVLERGRLVGIFSERDLVRACATSQTDVVSQLVTEFMTPDPITAQAKDDYNTVYMLMRINNIRHIPILEGVDLVGIVSIRDLIHFYQNKLETEYSEARERVEELKKLIHLSTEEVLDTLFAEINKYKELSLTDALTGLYNKRYFMMRLGEETARSKRHKQPLSLIFCDIDHFKNINDSHGHHIGDEILRQIGKILAGEMGDLHIVSRLRKSDIVARYGGEEFVAILPETSAENAKIAAEKIRKMIEERTFEVSGRELRITMSFGVAGLSESVKNPEDFIGRADAAMYHAKESGRNRVEIYQEAAASN